MQGEFIMARMKLSIVEVQRRQKSWDQVLANFALENIKPTPEIERIGKMYINGDITLQERSKFITDLILYGEKNVTKTTKTRTNRSTCNESCIGA